MPSGFIILLQISTATMLSLAWMAVRNVGLNINSCRCSRWAWGSGWTRRKGLRDD